MNRIKTMFDMTQHMVTEVTKTEYTLDNGDVYEHTFDIDDSITVEEFQTLLDNARSVVTETINASNK